MTERRADAAADGLAGVALPPVPDGPSHAPAGRAAAAPPQPAGPANPYTSPTVDAGTRNAALRALFMTDPHFRQHDGLDIRDDEVVALQSSPQARRRTIERARALGLLDDDLLDQGGPDAAAEGDAAAGPGRDPGAPPARTR